jgi:hypothetical protein
MAFIVFSTDELLMAGDRQIATPRSAPLPQFLQGSRLAQPR